MKNKLMKVRNYLKKHKIIGVLLLILVIFAVYLGYNAIFGSSGTTQYVWGEVKRGSISSTVTGTGQVSGLNQLQIKPQGSGTITEVAVKQGDRVKTGQKIFVIDQRSALTQISQAQGSVQSAQVNYNKLIAGASELDLSSTKLSLDNARTGLINKLNDTYTQVDNLIRNNIDGFYVNATSFSPKFTPSYYSSEVGTITFDIWDINQQIRLNYERAHATEILSKWRTLLSNVNSDNLASVESQSESYLDEIKNFIDDLGNGVNTLSADGTEYASRISTLKSTASSARSSINSIISGLVSSNQSFKSAQISYEQKVAPPTKDDVMLAKIQLNNAQISLQNANNNYENNIVRAPFDGVIAQLDAQAGDVVGGVSSASGAAVAAVLITDKKVAEIPLNEVDAAKVKIGDKATITFDALPTLTATGTVIQMDSVGTVTQGVVTYKTKVSIDTAEEAIKPGMSASVSVITNTKEDILLVPSSAIKTNGVISTVQVVDVGISSGANANIETGSKNNITTVAPRTVRVEVGISNDIQTEILSGLKEGDRIVTRTIASTQKNSSAAATTNTNKTQTPGLFGGGATRRSGF